MTKQQIINLAADRLTPGFLEESDIWGFMATILEVLDDRGISERDFFGTTDQNKAIDDLYLMGEKVRLLYLA